MSTSREADSSIQDTSGFDASRSKNTTAVHKAALDSSQIEEASHGTRTSQSVIADMKKDKDQLSSPDASAVMVLAPEDRAMEIKEHKMIDISPKPVQEQTIHRAYNTQAELEPSIACV